MEKMERECLKQVDRDIGRLEREGLQGQKVEKKVRMWKGTCKIGEGRRERMEVEVPRGPWETGEKMRWARGE